MLNFSRKLQTECKKAKLDEQDRAMADLMVLGWSPQDAFIAAGFNKPMLSDEYNKQQLEIKLAGPDFNKYIEARQKSIKRGILKQYTDTQDEDEDKMEVKILTKEEVLQEAVQTALLLPKNDPKRVDVLMKFAELAQMKKEEIKEEDTTIHFFLPLSCKQCSLYMEHQNKLKKKSGA